MVCLGGAEHLGAIQGSNEGKAGRVGSRGGSIPLVIQLGLDVQVELAVGARYGQAPTLPQFEGKLQPCGRMVASHRHEVVQHRQYIAGSQKALLAAKGVVVESAGEVKKAPVLVAPPEGHVGHHLPEKRVLAQDSDAVLGASKGLVLETGVQEHLGRVKARGEVAR